MSNQRIPVDGANKGLAFRVLAMIAGAAVNRADVARLKQTLDAYDDGLATMATDLAASGVDASMAGTVRTLVAYWHEVVNTDNFVRASDSKTGKQVLDEIIGRIDQGGGVP